MWTDLSHFKWIRHHYKHTVTLDKIRISYFLIRASLFTLMTNYNHCSILATYKPQEDVHICK